MEDRSFLDHIEKLEKAGANLGGGVVFGRPDKWVIGERSM